MMTIRVCSHVQIFVFFQQVWKQRGEEYRVSGGQGWLWLSTNRKCKPVDMHAVGLRAVAKKLQARKRKIHEERSDDDPGIIVIEKSEDKLNSEQKAEGTSENQNSSNVVEKFGAGNNEIVEPVIKEETVEPVMKEETVEPVMKEETVGEMQTDIDVKEEVVGDDCVVKMDLDVKEEVIETELVKTDLDIKEEVIDDSGLVNTDLDVKEEFIDNAVEIKSEPNERVEGSDNYIEMKSEPFERMETSESVQTDGSNNENGSKLVDENDSLVKVGETDIRTNDQGVKSKPDLKEESANIDVESVSPRKDLGVRSMKSQGNIHVVKHNLSTFSLLTQKADVDLIDVSKSISEHTYYPKISKPYAKLDNLLERRLKMAEAEKRQRDGIEQQIQWKLKLEAANNTKGESVSPEKKIISLPVSEKVDTVEKKVPKRLFRYECYSPLCKMGDLAGGECYSAQCRAITEQEADEEDDENDEDEAGDVSMEVDDDEDDVKTNESESAKIEPNTVKADKNVGEDEEIDIMEDKEEKSSASKSEDSVTGNQNTNNTNSNVKPKPPVMHVTETKTGTNVQITSKGVTVTSNDTKTQSTANILGSPGSKKTTTISIPGNLAQMIAAKGGTTLTMSQAQQLIKETLEKMSVEDLKAKVPPQRKSCDKVRLLRMTKLGAKRRAAKKTSLPVAHKFKYPSGVKSLFVLEKWEAKKLARKCGRTEITAFKYDCKMNNVNWPYPCPRPLFKTAYRYRMQTVKSLAGAALGLRILWACVRWDDMATKAPAGGTNTTSTETEITTTELLKRRDIGPYTLRSEFLVRKIVVPLGVPQQPKGKYKTEPASTLFAFVVC